MDRDRLKKIGRELEQATKDFALILPESVREEFLINSFIAGGSIFSLYNDETPKDYDFFLTSKDFALRLEKAILLESELKYVKGIKVGKYRNYEIIVTKNAISIGIYQIILNWTGSPDYVLKQFDFMHNMFYYKDNQVENIASWRYIKEKRLYFNDERPRDLCGVIIRANKFISRGFKITNKEMAKILLKLNEKGFTERELEILNSFEGRNNFGSGD